MAKEIERKFLLKSDAWRTEVLRSMKMIQGYFALDHPTLRVRIHGTQAWLTIKGKTEGISRSEFEYSIPVLDAQEMLETFCGQRKIEKIRHIVQRDGNIWEIDEFTGRHDGLFVAEIELQDVSQTFIRPAWIGEEVSGQARYYNQVMAQG